MYVRILCSCLWIQSVLKLACCNLHSKFKEFEELTPDNFTVLVKRDVMSGQVHFKIVTFFALRKYFVLHLVPGSPVLREDFEVNMVDGHGRMTRVPIDQQIFYTGYLHGNRQHSVDAVHTDGLWIAQIRGPDDEYSIEPRTHHEPDSSVTSMLIFRQRDIDSSSLQNLSDDNAAFQPFCEELHFKHYPIPYSKLLKKNHPNKKNSLSETIPNERANRKNKKNLDTNTGNNIFTEQFNSEEYLPKDFKIQYTDNHRRRRRSQSERQSRLQDTCEMLAVADFETYKGVGRRNIYRVVATLVYLYQVVDRLYRPTYFDTFTNLGIVLVKVMVHTEYTPVGPDQIHYNMAYNRMNGMNTLVAMSQVTNFSYFCLVHLTTQRQFSGTLGVAATAEETSDSWSNGICAMIQDQSRNIGLSTPVTANGHPMSLTVSMILSSTFWMPFFSGL